MSSIHRITEDLEKPSLDDRSYRVIELPNKLEALLVHDAETDKASASMSVDVGSFSDDKAMPGMAHAVEHLLFMGTKKYPVENEYGSYLSSHAGHSNAYTAPTQTNYFFECAASNEAQSTTSDGVNPVRGPFHGALDRFAQFFVEPLFLEPTLDRELQAVDSENKKNLQSDQWRIYQLSKTLSNPKHPFSNFSTGSLQTLRDQPEKRGVKIREAFMDFYAKHYSANRMKLVVLGKEPLDEMEKWVQELFTKVENKDLSENRWDGPDQPLTKTELSTQVFAKPVMESRTLEIWFPYSDEEALFETQPSRYLGHVLGHEGPGSILSLLKEKGWAQGLSCGYYPVCPGTAFFDFRVSLTPEGLEQYQQILKIIFQYIALMKQQPPQQWVFDEIKTVADVNFRFKQKSPPSRFTSGISATMQKPLPRKWLLSSPSTLRRFDSEAIVRAMQHLRPDNFRLVIISQDLPADLVVEREKWYGTEYAVQPLPVKLLAELEASLQNGGGAIPKELHLPHKNEFIPTRLDVEKKEISQPAKAPKLLRNDDKMRLWWKKDDRFWVPKASFLVTMRNPLVYATPANHVKTLLFCELVKDSLSEYGYDAEISGLSYDTSSTDNGIDINVSGYNDKLRVLLEKTVACIAGLEVKNERFKIVKEQLTRRYKNWDYQQPYYQVGSYFSWLTESRAWMSYQFAAELPSIEAEDIRAFIPHILGPSHFEILAHGNLYKEDALQMAALVETAIKTQPLPRSLWHVRRNVLLPPGSNHIYQRKLADPANVNHTIYYGLLIGDRSDRSLKIKAQLFAQMLKEPTFDQLRTKEQLGYVVFSGSRLSTASTFYRVLIQSERDPGHLEGRIEAHLSSFRVELETMEDTAFEAHRRSIINQKQEKLKNLESETGRLMESIMSEYYDFDKTDLDVLELEKVKKSEMMDFYHQYIDPSSKTRAKLSVHMVAQGSVNKEERKVSPAQQTEAISDALSKLLDQKGVSCDAKTLTSELEKVNLAGGDQEGVIAVARQHANDSLPAEQVKSVTQEIREALPPLFMALGITPAAIDMEEPQQRSEKNKHAEPMQTNGMGPADKIPAVMIKDVDAWKAGLRLSEGPRPVADLSEYEELEAKL